MGRVQQHLTIPRRTGWHGTRESSTKTTDRGRSLARGRIAAHLTGVYGRGRNGRLADFNLVADVGDGCQGLGHATLVPRFAPGTDLVSPGSTPTAAEFLGARQLENERMGRGKPGLVESRAPPSPRNASRL